MKIGIVLLLVVGVTASAAQNKPNLGTAAKSQRSFVGDVPTTIADSVAETLKFAEGSFLGVAEAMPEDKYGYVPTAGKFDDARSFGEQVKHVACAQFAMFNEFEGKKPPDDCERGGHDPAKTKAELIKYLKDSFDFRIASATLTAKTRWTASRDAMPGRIQSLEFPLFQFGT
jgi:hypothetical protein